MGYKYWFLTVIFFVIVIRVYGLSAYFIKSVDGEYYLYKYSITEGIAVKTADAENPGLLYSTAFVDNKIIFGGRVFFDDYRELTYIYDIEKNESYTVEGILINDIRGDTYLGTHDFGIVDYLDNNHCTETKAVLPLLSSKDMQIIDLINGKMTRLTSSTENQEPYIVDNGTLHFDNRSPRYTETRGFAYLSNRGIDKPSVINVYSNGLTTKLELPDKYFGEIPGLWYKWYIDYDVYDERLIVATTYYLLSISISEIENGTDINEAIHIIIETDQPILHFNTDREGKVFLLCEDPFDDMDKGYILTYDLRNNTYMKTGIPDFGRNVGSPYIILDK